MLRAALFVLLWSAGAAVAATATRPGIAPKTTRPAPSHPCDAPSDQWPQTSLELGAEERAALENANIRLGLRWSGDHWTCRREASDPRGQEVAHRMPLLATDPCTRDTMRRCMEGFCRHRYWRLASKVEARLAELQRSVDQAADGTFQYGRIRAALEAYGRFKSDFRLGIPRGSRPLVQCARHGRDAE